jgi:hypothetical protein
MNYLGLYTDYLNSNCWFAATENLELIAALKDNRLFAPSPEEKYQGHFIKVNEVALSDKQSVKGYLKGYKKEMLLVKRVFTNKEGNTGELTLVCSNTTLDGDYVSTIY